MADDLTSKIEQNATAPASASGDSGSMSQHSLQDQIAVDRYARQTRSRRGGIRFFKLVPGSASGVDTGSTR